MLYVEPSRNVPINIRIRNRPSFDSNNPSFIIPMEFPFFRENSDIRRNETIVEAETYVEDRTYPEENSMTVPPNQEANSAQLFTNTFKNIWI